ncbi:MAG: Sip1-related alpha-galactosidase [Rikenellaceae bacterium]
MRNILLSLLFCMSHLISMAQTLDLTQTKKNEVYSLELGGEPTEGIINRLSTKLPEYKRATLFASRQSNFNDINQLLSWQATDISKFRERVNKKEAPQNAVYFLALELTDNKYMIVQPISALELTSWIEVKDKNTIDIVTGSMGKGEVKKSLTPIVAYATGDDLYELLSKTWIEILDIEQVKGRTVLRSEKKYPESYKYLGWCSWEQYKKEIDEKLLVDAVDKLEKSDLPIRWVLVDDGHQNQIKTALVDYTPNKTRFPNGWEPLLSKRSEKIKWFGLWHCMYGLWRGISPKHNMNFLKGNTINFNKTNLVIAPNDKVSEDFYSALVNSVSVPGFDFAKVDVQTRGLTNYIGTENAVSAQRRNAQNLEKFANERLNGLMNCMALNLPSIFNTRYSATTRVSIDYKLNNRERACSHIHQSFQNTSWIGQTVWPDHDMFHSSDLAFGRYMAVSKALSGAPIYLSDAPEDFVAEYISPLAYADGELLRPSAPGAPLPSSFFADAVLGGDAYYVIAPTGETSAAIVAYNLTNDVAKIKASISAEDYTHADAMSQPYTGARKLPKEGLAYYDWYTKKGGKLDKSYDFELENAKDRLIILSEIKNNWAVIGAEDKYLSPVAVKSVKSSKSSLKLTLKEAGSVIIYSKTKIKSSKTVEVTSLGGGLYKVDSKQTSIALTR